MNRLIPEESVLLVVDVQERLAPAMPKDRMAELTKNARILIDAARILGVRVLATEQYPKGLGPTIPELADPLRALGVTPFSKTSFDALGDEAVSHALARAPGATEKRGVVVIGMESHVCVFQTVRSLVALGFSTHVVSDAVSSRREENRLAGISLCERAGAFATVTETVVFDWLRAAGTDAFKEVSKLVR